MNEDHNMNQQYEHIKLDPAQGLNIGYQIKPPPPIVGYWVLPPHDTAYKTKFAVYCSKPTWLHRTSLRIVLGIKWEDEK